MLTVDCRVCSLTWRSSMATESKRVLSTSNKFSRIFFGFVLFLYTLDVHLKFFGGQISANLLLVVSVRLRDDMRIAAIYKAI